MDLFDLSGKVAFVTGGNSGIGLGCARGLAKAGATVAIASRNMDKSLQAVKDIEDMGGKALAVQCDVTDQKMITDAVETVINECGKIDILVNNAGVNVRKRPEELTYEEWRTVLDTNLDSVFHCSRAVYPSMKASGGGKIMNNGSMLAIFGSSWGSAYSTSKGGMVQFTKSLATAWAQDNIQVNCFLPGFIDTPLTVVARKQVEGFEDNIFARTPAKRWGTMDDFEGVAVFLASPASDFVTGAILPVDGGYSINLM